MHRLPVLSTALVLLLAGCGDSTPTGQVIATVNGEEITRAEVNAALPRNVSADPKQAAQVRNAVLDDLVSQRLVVQEAKRQNIDKSQEYLLAQRRAESQLLSDFLSRRVLQDLHAPNGQSVTAYIAGNPTRFADRVVLQVDQLRAPIGGLDPQSLKDVHTLAGVAARFQAANVQVQRAQAAIDSATLQPAALRQLLSLPAGEPFIVAENGMLIVSAIIGRQPAPLTGDAAQKAAGQIMQQDAAREALTKQLKALRNGAEIRYQDGFASPKGPAKATPAT